MSISEFLKPEHWMNSGSGPRYVQLRKRIEKGIENGLLEPNMSLPPEREIAAMTELSRVTVRKAMQELVNNGAVIQKQGSGSYVADAPPHVELSLSKLTSFTEDMARRGLSTASKWLERGIFMPSAKEIETLALSNHDSVARIARLRSAGDRPMAIERASLPLDLLPNPTIVITSLYEVLEVDGHRPVRALQKISAINLDEETAKLLEVEVNAAGLRIERISFLPDDRVVEFTRSIYRGDAYDFVAEMRLSNQ
jgi:GntR family transcriptional regulator